MVLTPAEDEGREEFIEAVGDPLMTEPLNKRPKISVSSISFRSHMLVIIYYKNNRLYSNTRGSSLILLKCVLYIFCSSSDGHRS